MIGRAYRQMHPGLQFLLFAVVAVVAILLGNAIGAGIIIGIYGLKTLLSLASFDLNTVESVRALWILQIVGTTIPILLTPVFFAFVVVKEPLVYLKTRTTFPPVLLLIVFLLMSMSLPIIEVLTNVNQHLALPQFLKGVEDWMKASEQQAERVTAILLKMDTPLDMIKALLLIAALTAIVEELMFRGALQSIFIRWTKNPHAAIWITGALFSAFHMEFYGFLPRLLLGVYFGYFVYWSGSIWTSIWAHFLNNGTAVVLTYLYQHKSIHVNPDDQHVFNYSGYLMSIIITVLLLINYRNIALKAKQLPNI